MNIAPVSIRTLLIALIRPMPTNAPRQEASAAASSERADPCDGRDGERDIKLCSLFPDVLQPLAPSPVCCSCVNDEPVMRIDRTDVNVLAEVDQRIMATRQVQYKLLQLTIDRRVVTVDYALHQLL